MNRPLGVYWKPNKQFIDELVEYIGNKSVLEIFAGNGYLAHKLRSKGVNLIATSIFSSHDCHNLKMYSEVLVLDAISAVHEFHNRDVLLLSWPTTTIEAYRAIELWGPCKDIIFIGEVTDYSKNHLGGCSTDHFFESIEITSRFESYLGNYMEHAIICKFRG